MTMGQIVREVAAALSVDIGRHVAEAALEGDPQQQIVNSLKQQLHLLRLLLEHGLAELERLRWRQEQKQEQEQGQGEGGPEVSCLGRGPGSCAALPTARRASPPAFPPGVQAGRAGRQQAPAPAAPEAG
jgi:hypothetical protein